MKKIETIIRLFTVLLLVLFVFLSCDNNNDDSSNNTLRIISVNKTTVKDYAGTLQPVDTVYLANMYYFEGTGLGTLSKITYNDVDIAFNSTMVTNKGVFVTIPDNILYDNTVINNSFKFYTINSTLVYPFPILSPDPELLNVTKAIPDAGDLLTIKAYLPISVSIGGVLAETVGTPTTTEIKVKVPQGFKDSGDLIVLSAYGLSSPLTLGIDYFIYENDFSGSPDPVGTANWGGGFEFSNTEEVSRGAYSIKRVTAGWSLGWFDFIPVDVKEYKYLKISVHPDVVRSLRFSIYSEVGVDEDTASGDKHGIEIQLVPGEWNHISIPISDLLDLTEPDANTIVKRLYIRDLNGAAANIYLDDIGFI